MAITTVDGVFNALANDFQKTIIDKASIANLTANLPCSLWRATGNPGQGAIPAAAAIPTAATLGAIALVNQTAPKKSYLAWLGLRASNALTSIELADRVAHQGGLVFNLATSQTTNLPLDVSTLSLVAARRGATDYSELQWFLEVYTDGGATASNATINVTYNDATTGNLNVVAVGGTLRASRILALTPLIPTGSQGKFIRGINSVILSASTGTAGSFGFTCYNAKTGLEIPIATLLGVASWDDLGAPEIPPDACMTILLTNTTTTSGTLQGGYKLANG